MTHSAHNGADLILCTARSHCFLFPSKIKLVNINIPDIIDGKPSIILGLIWTIILQYHVSLKRFYFHFFCPFAVERFQADRVGLFVFGAAFVVAACRRFP